MQPCCQAGAVLPSWRGAAVRSWAQMQSYAKKSVPPSWQRAKSGGKPQKRGGKAALRLSFLLSIAKPA